MSKNRTQNRLGAKPTAVRHVDLATVATGKQSGKKRRLEGSALAAACAVGLAMLAASPAMAGDRNHGSACRPNSWDATKVGINVNGIYNNSASTAVVHCSAGKGLEQLSINWLKTTIYDPSQTADASCVVRVTNDLGQVTFSNTIGTTGFSNQPMIVATQLPAYAGFVHMECTLPPQVGPSAFHLMSYAVSP